MHKNAYGKKQHHFREETTPDPPAQLADDPRSGGSRDGLLLQPRLDVSAHDCTDCSRAPWRRRRATRIDFVPVSPR